MTDKIIVGYCMGCGKVKYPHDTEWEYPRNTSYKSLDCIELSHDYCEPCGDKVILEARAEMERLKVKKMEWVSPVLLGPFSKDKLLVDKFEYGIGGGK